MMKKFNLSLPKAACFIAVLTVSAAVCPVSSGAYDAGELSVYNAQLTDEEKVALGLIYEDRQVNEEIGSVIKLYYVPMEAAFAECGSIDEVMDSQWNLGYDYVVEDKMGKCRYFNADFSEKMSTSWSAYDRSPEPPVSLPIRIRSVYNMPEILNDIDPEAAIQRIYCIQSETQGTAVCYVTDRGDYVYFCNAKDGSASLMTGEDFAAYQKSCYENLIHSGVSGDVNGDGDFTVADAVTVQRWLLNDAKVTMVNWRAADLCEDGVIDVFDFCLLKKELLGGVGKLISPSVDGAAVTAVTVRDAMAFSTYDTYVYTSPDKIGAIADYFNGLHLREDFSDDPDECAGMPWKVSLDFADGESKEIWMFGNAFYREDDGKCLKMDYFEAEEFTRLIYGTPADEFIGDPLKGVSVPPSEFDFDCVNEEERVYEHGEVVRKVFEVRSSSPRRNVSFTADVVSAEGVEVVGEPVCIKNGSRTKIIVAFRVMDGCRPGNVVFEMSDGEHTAGKKIVCWHDGNDFVSSVSLDVMSPICRSIADYLYAIDHGGEVIE